MDPADYSASELSRITGVRVLNCLGKQPAPPTLAVDLARTLELPATARSELWQAVEPSLSAVNTPHSLAALAAFCDLHRLEPQDVAPMVGAFRFLLLRGAERNTTVALLEEDVRALLSDRAGDENLDAVVTAILAAYELAAPKLRLKVIYEALTDHGRVITDVKWRVDQVSHANTGEAINVPVTLLTLRYREGEQTGQMTVQVLPDELRKLLAACEQALR